ncbi:MAG: hypothetical protein R3C44_14400 [Chloroflexota bacterium]
MEPDEGTIRLGTMDLSAINAATWRGQAAWVPQLSYLFNTTVAENIRLGRPLATDEDVVAAAKAAHAHEFILDLPRATTRRLARTALCSAGGSASVSPSPAHS